MLKRILKNERGLTLIELLAVVVILGIIAAIAIPSIGGIIDNSRKDAHVANAQQMIASAKMAVSADPAALPTSGSTYLTLGYLTSKGYLTTIKDPDSSSSAPYYADSKTAVQTSTVSNANYVKITLNADGTYTYHVHLANTTRGVDDDESSLSREDVKTTVTTTAPTS